jgi:hypothetical protein
MEKQPFDEAGLQSLLSDLYALPEEQLQEESLALKQQPKLWVNGHFALDQKQLDFLAQLPHSTAQFIGDQGSFAIANRLPVTLQKKHEPKPKTNAGDDQDKFFKLEGNLASGTDNHGIPQASGELHINVTYFDEQP